MAWKIVDVILHFTQTKLKGEKRLVEIKAERITLSLSFYQLKSPAETTAAT